MKNNSNFHPIGNKLIVWIDCVEGIKMKTSTKGIFLTGKIQSPEEQAYEATTGILVEMPDECYEKRKNKPKLGDRLVFRPYAGIHIIGDDGNFYRILEDREINAIHLIKEGQKIVEFEKQKTIEELAKEEREKQRIERANLTSKDLEKEIKEEKIRKAFQTIQIKS